MISKRVFRTLLNTNINNNKNITINTIKKVNFITLQRYLSTNNTSPQNIVTLDDAKKLPREFEEMSNDVITILAVLGDQEAREERLIREIMRVDGVTWQAAQPRFHQMIASNREGMWIATLPYKVGFLTAVSAAFLSIPMVFDLNTTLWFNEHFVTTGYFILFYIFF